VAGDSLYTSTEDASAVSSAWLSSLSLAVFYSPFRMREKAPLLWPLGTSGLFLLIVTTLDGFIFGNSSGTDIRQTTQTDNMDAAGVPPL